MILFVIPMELERYGVVINDESQPDRSNRCDSKDFGQEIFINRAGKMTTLLEENSLVSESLAFGNYLPDSKPFDHCHYQFHSRHYFVR